MKTSKAERISSNTSDFYYDPGSKNREENSFSLEMVYRKCDKSKRSNLAH
jgi:hypothetical protein